jgi:hypothetical protein
MPPQLVFVDMTQFDDDTDAIPFTKDENDGDS